MDFELVLKRLLAGFNGAQIRYAAIGGFALGVLGVPRQTMDLDFLVHRDAQERSDIERLMDHYGRRLDWARLEDYYKLFGLGEEIKSLKERFSGVD